MSLKHMYYRNHNMQHGYVALVTSLVVTFVALLMTVVSSQIIFSYAQSLQNDEEKIESRAAAHSCLSYALVNEAFENSYDVSSPGEKIKYGTYECTVLPFETVSSREQHIKSEAEAGSTFTALQLSIYRDSSFGGMFTVDYPIEQ